MLDEKSINAVRKIFSKHDYIMTTAELGSYKIYYADIQQLLNEGFIEKIKRGYYHWTEPHDEQEVKIINRLFSDAVLCMETALFISTATEILPSGILRLIKMFPEAVQISTIPL